MFGLKALIQKHSFNSDYRKPLLITSLAVSEMSETLLGFHDGIPVVCEVTQSCPKLKSRDAATERLRSRFPARTNHPQTWWQVE